MLKMNSSQLVHGTLSCLSTFCLGRGVLGRETAEAADPSSVPRAYKAEGENQLSQTVSDLTRG